MQGNVEYAPVGPEFIVPYVLFIGVASLVSVVAMWKLFSKAGKPGWASLVPFYNMYILITIAGKPGWWFLLLFVPLLNIVIPIIVSLELGKKFGKSVVFSLFLLYLLPPIGYMILAFGNATYGGNTQTTSGGNTPPAQNPDPQNTIPQGAAQAAIPQSPQPQQPTEATPQQ